MGDLREVSKERAERTIGPARSGALYDTILADWDPRLPMERGRGRRRAGLKFLTGRAQKEGRLDEDEVWLTLYCRVSMEPEIIYELDGIHSPREMYTQSSLLGPRLQVYGEIFLQ
jgi:hypothetical protein